MTHDTREFVRVFLIFGQIFCLFMIFVTIGVNMSQIGTANLAIFSEIGFGFLLMILANIERVFYDTDIVYHAVPQEARREDIV